MDFYKQWLGIPDGPRPPDHYELLRLVKFEDDTEKIRSFYKKLNAHVRKYATGQYMIQSQEMLNELARAMLCLTDAERKRDYDESLGREFPPEKDQFGRQPLLDVLVRQGDLSRDQKKEVEEFASRRGLSHQDAVAQMKFVSPEKASRALATQLGYSYVDLEDMVPEDEILDRVPRNLIKQNSIIPLFIDDGQLLVACIDQPEHELEDELRLRYEVPVRPVITTLRAINQAITQYYPPGTREVAKEPERKLEAGKAVKGKPKQKAGSTTSSSSQPAASQRVSFDKLSPNEQKERKQLGIVIIGQCFLLPLLLPQLILMVAPQYQSYMPSFVISLATSLVLSGLSGWWVTQRYWK